MQFLAADEASMETGTASILAQKLSKGTSDVKPSSGDARREERAHFNPCCPTASCSVQHLATTKLIAWSVPVLLFGALSNERLNAAFQSLATTYLRRPRRWRGERAMNCCVIPLIEMIDSCGRPAIPKGLRL